MLTDLPAPQFSASWPVSPGIDRVDRMSPAGVADARNLADVRATLAKGGRTVEDHARRLRISKQIAAGRVIRLLKLGMIARDRAGAITVLGDRGHR